MTQQDGSQNDFYQSPETQIVCVTKQLRIFGFSEKDAERIATLERIREVQGTYDHDSLEASSMYWEDEPIMLAILCVHFYAAQKKDVQTNSSSTPEGIFEEMYIPGDTRSCWTEVRYATDKETIISIALYNALGTYRFTYILDHEMKMPKRYYPDIPGIAVPCEFIPTFLEQAVDGVLKRRDIIKPIEVLTIQGL